MTELPAYLERVLQLANKPRPFATLLSAAESVDDADYSGVTEAAVIAALEGESWADAVHRVLRSALAMWDHAGGNDWIGLTEPNTEERRNLIYDLLEIGDELKDALNEYVPFYATGERLVVISDEFVPWYTPDRRAGASFYWDAFSSYLEATNGWEREGVLALEESSRQVVERISDPSQEGLYQSKGLVVGHVQSGKTANFAAVIARAGDAGYRLIIVLSGTMNNLRAQTQRRLDRELIGKELIRPQQHVEDDEQLDYLLDDDWGSFIEHGGRPSEMGSFDWIRLTGEADDYSRLRAGIESLNFVSLDPSKPFHDPANLTAAKAKIMIVKKNTTVLKRVARDLGRITARLSDVPALVIDDESDLASINTRKPPEGAEQKKRTAINKAIVELLKQLPRAQYVGYTATPFANVFISPADAEDLFPKDFIVALPRPRGYMGASDFHDLDGPPLGTDDDPYLSNEKAFIRSVRGADDADENLLRAIDSFVLAGAIKLFRKVELPEGATRLDPYRHHTMLVHSSRLIADQQAMAEQIREVIKRAGYEAGRGPSRLRELFTNDFAPVALSRGSKLPFPSGYDRLQPYVGKALSLIMGPEDPVLIVNGESDDEADFDKQKIWKILVGGAKLSRGYTIEGLTISYFRRAANAGDTLMQMGRWFGFRHLYQDLVRVFIGREEGRNGMFDIYEAFEGICRDEEAFRSELVRYAMPEDGSNPITPMQVPPLVANHLEWVPPTAKNKRFNAFLQFTNLGGRWSEKTLAPQKVGDIRANEALFGELISAASVQPQEVATSSGRFPALIGITSAESMMTILESYVWEGDARSVQREIEFLRGTGDRDPGVKDWLFVAPQLVGQSGRVWRAGDLDFDVRLRSRLQGGRVKVYTESIHRAAAEAVIAAEELSGESGLDGYRAPHRGVMLFYPVIHSSEAPTTQVPTMGFALLFPNNSIGTHVVWGVRDPTRQGDPVVDAK